MNVKQVISIPVLCAGLVLSGQTLADPVKSDITPPQQVQKGVNDQVSADGQYRYVGGELGWVPIQHEYEQRDGKWQHVDKLNHNEKTTQQVHKELDEFKRNPISADGQYRYVGGEQGWVPIQHEYAQRDGKWQHVDKLDHNAPAPSLEMSQEERKQRDALYQGG